MASSPAKNGKPRKAKKTATSIGGRRQDAPSPVLAARPSQMRLCGHIMQGSTRKRANGRLHNNYRCVYRSNYPGDVEHPRLLSVAESRVLPPLDMWLGRMFDPDHIDETIDTLLSLDQRIDADPHSVVEARRLAADAQARLERHIAAINAGFDPSLLVSDTRQAQTDLAKANGILAAHTARNTPAVLTPAMIRSVLLRHRGLPGLLRDVATPDERRQFYAGLGLSLAFERRIINGEITELFRPSFQAAGGEGSNSACRRGDLNSYSPPPGDSSSAPSCGCQRRDQTFSPLTGDSRPPPTVPKPASTPRNLLLAPRRVPTSSRMQGRLPLPHSPESELRPTPTAAPTSPRASTSRKPRSAAVYVPCTSARQAQLTRRFGSRSKAEARRDRQTSALG